MKPYQIKENILGVPDYQKLRDTTDWQVLPDSQVAAALATSLYKVSAWDGNNCVGMARIVGDGAMYFYIQDVIVAPKYQGTGIGGLLMSAIEAYLNAHEYDYAFVGLMAAAGVSNFYHHFGFEDRDKQAPGMFKIKNR